MSMCVGVVCTYFDGPFIDVVEYVLYVCTYVVYIIDEDVPSRSNL